MTTTMRTYKLILSGLTATVALVLVALLSNPLAPVVQTQQTGITFTTTSAAVTRAATSMALTSDTGVSAGTYLYVDGELMQARSEIGTTGRWNVRRGVDGYTGAAAHASGAGRLQTILRNISC